MENSRLTSLANQPGMKILMMTGDIHNTDFRSKRKPFEAIASGAARPFGNVFRPDNGNFGILDAMDAQGAITIKLYEALDHLRYDVRIDGNTWVSSGKVKSAPNITEDFGSTTPLEPTFLPVKQARAIAKLRTRRGRMGTRRQPELAVEHGAVGAGATRTTWAQLQPFLNSNCAATFAR